MRLLRDEQPVKQREPSPFGIGTEGRKAMYVLKPMGKGVRFKKEMLYYHQHKPLFTP
jgi:hypothetical protein